MSAVIADETGTAPVAQFPLWVPGAGLLAPVFAAVAGVLTSSLPVGTVVLLAASAVVIGWSDVSMRRIPNVMCAALSVFAFAAALVVHGVSLGSVVVGATATAVPFLVLHLMNPAWVGFGDVKLLAALGAALGLLSPLAGLGAIWLAGVGVLVSRPFMTEGWRRSVPFGFWLSVMSVPLALVVGVV